MLLLMLLLLLLLLLQVVLVIQHASIYGSFHACSHASAQAHAHAYVLAQLILTLMLMLTPRDVYNMRMLTLDAVDDDANAASDYDGECVHLHAPDAALNHIDITDDPFGARLLRGARKSTGLPPHFVTDDPFGARLSRGARKSTGLPLRFGRTPRFY